MPYSARSSARDWYNLTPPNFAARCSRSCVYCSTLPDLELLIGIMRPECRRGSSGGKTHGRRGNSPPDSPVASGQNRLTGIADKRRFGDTRAVKPADRRAFENLCSTPRESASTPYSLAASAPKPYAIPAKIGVNFRRHSRLYRFEYQRRHAVLFFCKPTAKECPRVWPPANDNNGNLDSCFFLLKRQTSKYSPARYRLVQAPQRVRAGKSPASRRPSKRKVICPSSFAGFAGYAADRRDR